MIDYSPPTKKQLARRRLAILAERVGYLNWDYIALCFEDLALLHGVEEAERRATAWLKKGKNWETAFSNTSLSPAEWDKLQEKDDEEKEENEWH